MEAAAEAMQARSEQLHLTYYAARGSMDKVRLLLAFLDEPYTETIVTGKQFSRIQNEIEFGALPLLQLGTFRLSQARPIFTYLADLHGMHGATKRDRAVNEMWIEACEEAQEALWSADFMVLDGSYSSSVSRRKFLDTVARKLARLCQMVEASTSVHLTGTAVSSADICLFALLESYEREVPLALAAFEPLERFHAEMAKEGRIAAFRYSAFRY